MTSHYAVIAWEVHFSCEDPDEFGWQLLELGADGLEVVEASINASDIAFPGGKVRCGYRGDQVALDGFIAEAANLGFSLLEIRQDDPTKWIQRWEEVWQPVVVGSFTLLPVSGDEDPVAGQHSNQVLRLIPGSGFGTGHHESTVMMLEMMQTLHAESALPDRVLDVGTGSGVLAIAAVKLSVSEVEAIDNDSLAILNANDNLVQNGITSGITLSARSLADFSEPFGLILANIYADVLTEMAPDFARLTNSGATILLSGILDTQVDDVLARYAADWNVVEHHQRGEWQGVRLVKK